MRLPEGFASHPASFPDTLWRAMCRDVIDGDTIVIELDAGFNQYNWFSVRLVACNAPEIFTSDLVEKAAGLKSKEALSNLILGKPILTLTAKDKDKYGRYLAAPYFFGYDNDWHSVIGVLVSNGYVKQTVLSLPPDSIVPAIYW